MNEKISRRSEDDEREKQDERRVRELVSDDKTSQHLHAIVIVHECVHTCSDPFRAETCSTRCCMVAASSLLISPSLDTVDRAFFRGRP